MCIPPVSRSSVAPQVLEAKIPRTGRMSISRQPRSRPIRPQAPHPPYHESTESPGIREK